MPMYNGFNNGNNGFNNGNNGYGYGYGNNNNGYNNIGYNNLAYQNNNGQFNQNQYGQQPSRDDHFQWVDYVNGRAGADAYQLPTGVNKAILFDNDFNRFFVKGYDNNGRPRVFEDNDFNPHINPEPQSPQNIDLSPYATKDDIQNMIVEALRNIQLPNMTGYVTVDQFNQALNELSVGSGGRIVRGNEQNA